MFLGTQAVTNLSDQEGAFLLDLALFPSGPLSAIDRIPDNIAGTYAWFRTYHYSEEPEKLCEQLMKDMVAQKFIKRTGTIKPFYEVTIESKSWFSDGKKAKLKSALMDPVFKRGLLDVLRGSILLQNPLYIGKASNIKKRIESHLKTGSVLRERFKSAMIEFEMTQLLIIPNATIEDHVNSIDMVDYNEDVDEIASDEMPYDSYELLYEEIYSRLFNPSFTIRLG